MPHDRLYINDNYALTANVYAADGITPVLPESATVDIVNQVTGSTVVTGGTCVVASGLATYYILSGSTVAQTAGRYVGFMRVEFDVNNAQTIPLTFDVLPKSSSLPVLRWIRKVASSSPSEEHITDEHARDWIDQAVDYINRYYDSGFTSVLGEITPTPSSSEIEFITSLASLLARFNWWAGKGNYRDEEISFDASPFAEEWRRFEEALVRQTNDSWFDADMGGTVYNRDNVFYRGVKYDSPDYWYRTSSDPDPETEIPI